MLLSNMKADKPKQEGMDYTPYFTQEMGPGLLVMPRQVWLISEIGLCGELGHGGLQDVQGKVR